jgi:hypothetical protein
MSMEEAPAVAKGLEHLFALVRERYGARLTEAELGEVRKGVEAIAHAGRALRAVRLDGSDEPMQPFSPFRADE